MIYPQIPSTFHPIRSCPVTFVANMRNKFDPSERSCLLHSAGKYSSRCPVPLMASDDVGTLILHSDDYTTHVEPRKKYDFGDIEHQLGRYVGWLESVKPEDGGSMMSLWSEAYATAQRAHNTVCNFGERGLGQYIDYLRTSRGHWRPTTSGRSSRGAACIVHSSLPTRCACKEPALQPSDLGSHLMYFTPKGRRLPDKAIKVQQMKRTVSSMQTGVKKRPAGNIFWDTVRAEVDSIAQSLDVCDDNEDPRALFPRWVRGDDDRKAKALDHETGTAQDNGSDVKSLEGVRGEDGQRDAALFDDHATGTNNGDLSKYFPALDQAFEALQRAPNAFGDLRPADRSRTDTEVGDYNVRYPHDAERWGYSTGPSQQLIHGAPGFPHLLPQPLNDRRQNMYHSDGVQGQFMDPNWGGGQPQQSPFFGADALQWPREPAQCNPLVPPVDLGGEINRDPSSYGRGDVLEGHRHLSSSEPLAHSRPVNMTPQLDFLAYPKQHSATDSQAFLATNSSLGSNAPEPTFWSPSPGAGPYTVAQTLDSMGRSSGGAEVVCGDIPNERRPPGN